MMPTFDRIERTGGRFEWKCIASTMPVTIWQTSAGPASTPKFQK
jgi:hypothetical protein